MLTLPPSCAVVTKSGNLNFLETSGPLQACNGTALSKKGSIRHPSNAIAKEKLIAYIHADCL